MIQHGQFSISGDGERWFKEQEWKDGQLIMRIHGDGNMCPENGTIIISTPNRTIINVNTAGTCCDQKIDWVIKEHISKDSVAFVIHKHAFKGVHQIVRIDYTSDDANRRLQEAVNANNVAMGQTRQRHIDNLQDLRRQIALANEMINVAMMNHRVLERINRVIDGCEIHIANLERIVNQCDYGNGLF
jgi:hypothetical protein